jgi:hypothetical protein
LIVLLWKVERPFARLYHFRRVAMSFDRHGCESSVLMLGMPKSLRTTPGQAEQLTSSRKVKMKLKVVRSDWWSWNPD